MSVSDLPAINASLNAIACVLLILGMVAIKRERKEMHGLLMGAAFVVSSIFLITYVTHKYLVHWNNTPFGGTGWIRPLYFGMLISHIILAIAVPPLAIATIRLALKQRYESHRRIAKITFPIWLYVSITGVLVYFMLYVWYPVSGAAPVVVPR